MTQKEKNLEQELQSIRRKDDGLMRKTIMGLAATVLIAFSTNAVTISYYTGVAESRLNTVEEKVANIQEKLLDFDEMKVIMGSLNTNVENLTKTIDVTGEILRNVALDQASSRARIEQAISHTRNDKKHK